VTGGQEDLRQCEQIVANHNNPDLMTAPADISVNGGPTFHVLRSFAPAA
jgi:hypothetical protein